ncbi:hypothetical protein KC909_02690, partial [Candidatus Dojkabacteria bacterium]|nr:hypothetical protein [Candidatus Dojkabacteria bacterium]
ENNFEHVNNNIGAGQEMTVLYDAPSNHCSGLFRVYNWGYYFLPKSYAFAFKWWIRGALLIIASFLLTKQITRDNFLSTFGSIALFFSPLIQWWYSVFVVDGATYLLFSIYFLIKIIDSEDRSATYKYLALLLLSSTLLLFIVYPPYIILSAFVLLIYFIGSYLNNRAEPKQKLILTSLTGILAGLIFGLFMFDLKDIIQIISNTTYPGSRITEGGGYSFYKIPYYFFNILSTLHSGELPLELHNLSEASGIIPLYLISIPITAFFTVIKIIKKQKINYVNTMLMILFLFILAWMLFGIPYPISSLLLLNKIPHNRSIHILSIINFIGIFHFLNSKDTFHKKINYKIFAYIYSFVLIFFLALYGISLDRLSPDFITALELTLILVFSWVIILTYFLKQKKFFVILLLLFSFISTYKVNPVYQGTYALTDITPIVELKDISANNNDARWVVFDDSTLSSMLIANGVPVISGLQLYPNFEFWEEFDKENEFNDNYNRYGHITFASTESEEVLISNPTAHLIEVMVNPCNDSFNKLNVQYYVFQEQVDEHFDCLVFDSKIDSADKIVYVYTTKNEN